MPVSLFAVYFLNLHGDVLINHLNRNEVREKWKWRLKWRVVVGVGYLHLGIFYGIFYFGGCKMEFVVGLALRKYGLDANTIVFIGHAFALHRDDRSLDEPALDTVKTIKVKTLESVGLAPTGSGRVS